MDTYKNVELVARTRRAIIELEVELTAIHALRSRLKSSVNDTLALAMKSGSKELAAHYQEEGDNLAALLDIARSAEMLLQNLSIKIESARYLQELVAILDRAAASLRVIKSGISTMMPVLDSTLDTIGSSIAGIKSDLKIQEVLRERTEELPEVTARNATELPAVPKIARMQQEVLESSLA